MELKDDLDEEWKKGIYDLQVASFQLTLIYIQRDVYCLEREKYIV